MGIFFERIRFLLPGPTIEVLCRQIEGISGLPVTFREMDDECKGNLFDILGYLTFTDLPDTQIRISSYRTGAVDELTRSYLSAVESYMVVPSNHYERPGEQSIHLQGYVGQEMTLFMTALIAMQDLGGILDQPISEEEIRRYRQKITPEIVRTRLRKSQSMSYGFAILTILLLPLMMVLAILKFLFFLIFVLPQYRRNHARKD